MKKILLPILVLIIAFTSCQKEIQWNPDDNPDTTTDNTGDYQPMTTNSKWTYRVHQTFKIDSTLFNGIDLSQLGLSINDLLAMMGQTQTVTDTTYQYEVACTGRDTAIGATSYKVFTSTMTGAPQVGYLRKDNGNYYQRGALMSMGTGDIANGDVQMLYLKSNQPVGYTWTEQVSFTVDNNTAQDEIKYTIKSKGATKEVNGKTYKDVIQVEVKITPKVENMPEMPGMNLDFSSTTEMFFAKDIGFIYEELKPMMGTSMTVELISTDIK